MFTPFYELKSILEIQKWNELRVLYTSYILQATEEGSALTCIINNALSVVYNVSLVESNISHLRKLNFTEVLQRFLASKDKDDHLCALAALACITDEKEAEIINSNTKVVKYLMKVLRHALKSSDRRCAGWSCKELAVGKINLRHITSAIKHSFCVVQRSGCYPE